MKYVELFRLIGMLICITKMQKDIKATIEEMRAEKVITEEEYSYIVGKMENRLT